MPEVLFTPFYSANGMIPAHSLGPVPKNSKRKTILLVICIRIPLLSCEEKVLCTQAHQGHQKVKRDLRIY